METLSMSNISAEAQASHVSAAVAAVAQMQQGHQQQHHHQQLIHSPNSNSSTKMDQELEENLTILPVIQEMEEIQEDIVSIPKEVILISLVSQEQALYNPKHEHYRNTQRKDAKWLDIADSVGWSEIQCKAKWKAMRDQYCRELKRSKFNAKANVKWKYFKELDFLRPFALSRNYRPRINSNNSISIIHNNNNNNNNNNNSITLPHNATTFNAIENIQDDDNKFPNIKIEAGQYNATDFVTTTAQLKTEHRLIASLTNEQLNVMQQQQQQDGNWSYITTTTAATAAIALARSNNNEIHIKTSGSVNNNTSNNSMHTTTATTSSDEALYNSFVAQITQQQQNVLVTAAGQIQHQQELQQHQQQQQQNPHINPDDEDDDPIHTFLNIESYFEKELIAMIQQEDILYNSFHSHYRNVKMKLEVWDEIARKLKKTVKQCRLKWKALRDQYIREHKRLKNRENPESLPRWKHYDALSFLQKFIKHKSWYENDLDKTLIEIPKTEIDIDMEEPCLQSPKLSPLHVASSLQQQQQQHMQQLQQHALPSLSGPHNVTNNNNNDSTEVQNTLQHQLQHSLHHQQQQLLQHTHHHNQHQVADEHDETLCAVACDVSAYDDMDINDYIIGDGDDADVDHDDGGGVGGVGGVSAVDRGGPEDGDDDIEDNDEDIDRKSQHFPVYSPPVDSTVNSNDHHGDDDDEMKQQQQEDEEQQQQQQRHILTSFKTSHDGSLPSQAQTSNSHSLSQQSAVLQQHLQQQQHHQLQPQQHIVNLENEETTQTQEHSDHDFADSLHTSLLNGNATNATTPTTTTSAVVNEISGLVAGLRGGGATSLNSATATAAGYSLATASADDDEVGAFFKAVAMKIRSAKMSPVAFTDLQINILRVINGTLRNH